MAQVRDVRGRRPPVPTRPRSAGIVGQATQGIGYLFRSPFTIDSADTLTLSLAQRELRRRTALLRLIALCIAGIMLLVLPIMLFGGLVPAFYGIPVLCEFVLALVALALGQGRTATWGAALLTYGSLLLLLVAVRLGPNVLDERVLLLYSLFSVFILVASMVLPQWLLWPTVFLVVGVCAFGIFNVSFSPPPGAPPRRGPGPGGPADMSPDLRISAALTVSVLHLLVGTMAWVAARSTAASIRASARVGEREHELAALKDQFIVDANHELRTPIMSLYGNLELLATLGDGATPDQRERLLRRALRSGEATLRLLTSVLDTGTIESGTPHVALGTVTVAPLVQAVLETFDPREIGEPELEDDSHESRPVSIHVDDSLAVLADETRLRQILVNLLSNALKYSPPGSPIDITAEYLPPAQRLRSRIPWARRTPPSGTLDSGFVRISVRDRGLGVPPRDAHKLFNRFVRLERDIAGAIRGTGVGLYMCRVLTEAMGGRIWVESRGEPGAGSTFRFTLPAVLDTPVAEAERFATAPVGVVHP